MSTNKRVKVPRVNGEKTILERQQHAIAMALRNVACMKGHFQRTQYQIAEVIRNQGDIAHREDMIAILGMMQELAQKASVTEQLIRLRAASIRRRNESDRKFHAGTKKVNTVSVDTIAD